VAKDVQGLGGDELRSLRGLPMIPSQPWTTLLRLPRPHLGYPFLAMGLGLLVGAGLALAAWSPRSAAPAGPRAPAPPPRPRPPDLLALALVEARDNHDRAARLGALPADVRFPTGRIRDALSSDPRVLHGERGELEALEEEARWLEALRTPADLSGRSWDDVVFLCGLFEWYLGRAQRGPRAHPPRVRHDPEELREFQGMTWPDLLGALD
jgi:hypothetical protein